MQAYTEYVPLVAQRGIPESLSDLVAHIDVEPSGRLLQVLADGSDSSPRGPLAPRHPPQFAPRDSDPRTQTGTTGPEPQVCQVRIF